MKWKNPKIIFDIETTGLNPYFGSRITCIGIKDTTGNRYCIFSEDESYIIDKFYMYLLSMQIFNPKYITMNGKMFDIPFILTRNHLLKLRHDFSMLLEEDNNTDIFEFTPKWVSLESMAIILGFPENERKTGSGLVAIKLFHAKRYDELKEYCLRDVDLTEKVYNRMMSLRQGFEQKKLI